MAQGEGAAGAVWVDLLIRDTIEKQLSGLVGKLGAAADRDFGRAGKSAGRQFAGGFDRSVAAAQRTVARLQKQVAGLEDQLGGIEAAKLQDVAGMFPSTKSRDDYVGSALAGDKAYQKLMAQAARVDQQLEAAQDRLAVAVEAACRKQAQAAEAAAERAAAAQEQAASRTRRAALRAVDTVRRAASAGLSAVKKAAGGAAALAGRAAAGLQKSWQAAAQKAGRALSVFGRTARRVFVLGSILAFFRGMRDAMQGAMQQNDQLAASLARIRGSLATAFSAVFTAALPALQALMNGLAALTAKLASFLSALFGTTVSRAGAAAKKLGAVGSSAGRAAKQLQGALAGFDELNVLQRQQEDTDGGAAGAGYDFGAAADAGASGFGEQLRAAILAQDWDGLGLLLGEKVNSLVDRFDAHAWGARLGRVLQAGIATLWRFIETVDWNAIGRKAGEFLTSALDEIDAWKLGQLLTAKVRIGLELLQGFAETFDWALFGQKVSDGLIGALENLADSIKEVDWDNLGRGIADCIRNIDFSGISEALGDLVGSAFRGMFDFFSALLEEPLAAAKELFLAGWNATMANAELYEDAGTAVVAGLFNGIWSVMSGVYAWLMEHVFTPFMNGFKAAFGINSPSTVMAEMGRFLVLGVLNGIIAVWGRVTGFFTDSLEGIKALFSDAWMALQESTQTLWNGIRDTIKGAINSIIGLVNGLAQAAANGINAVIDILNRLHFTVPDWVPGLGGKSFGFDLPKVSAPQIPLLAGGGVITQPTLAMMGEYQGAGRNPEIVAPEDKLRGIFAESLGPLLELLAELLALLRDGGDQEIVIRFAASGGIEQLVRLLLPYIDKEQTRVGAKLVTGGVY